MAYAGHASWVDHVSEKRAADHRAVVQRNRRIDPRLARALRDPRGTIERFLNLPGDGNEPLEDPEFPARPGFEILLWEEEDPAADRPEEQKYPPGQARAKSSAVNPEPTGFYLPRPGQRGSCYRLMQSSASHRSGRRIVLVASFLILASAYCRPTPNESLRNQYQDVANKFCTAMVDCMKEEISQRLATQPQKRDFLIRRLDQDYCIEGQFEIIQGLESRNEPEQIMKNYQSCAEAVTQSESCQQRRAVLASDESCKKMRALPEDSP